MVVGNIKKYSEAQIEKHLFDEVNKLNGIAYKFTSPGHAGVPDRIIMLPNGLIILIELKKETGTLSELQINTINKMQNKNIEVYVLYSIKDVDEFIAYIKKRLSKSQPKFAVTRNKTVRLGTRVKLNAVYNKNKEIIVKNTSVGRVININTDSALVRFDIDHYDPRKEQHKDILIHKDDKIVIL